MTRCGTFQKINSIHREENIFVQGTKEKVVLR